MVNRITENEIADTYIKVLIINQNFSVMRKLILFAAIILTTGIAFGQTLQKGNLIGSHVVTATLMPGVTMEKYIDFYKTKVIPEMEKNMPNLKIYVVKSIRGENMNSFGMIAVFKSAQERDKYYNTDGSDSELGKSVNAKLKPVMDELGKLGTLTTKYNDWIVQ